MCGDVEIGIDEVSCADDLGHSGANGVSSNEVCEPHVDWVFQETVSTIRPLFNMCVCNLQRDGNLNGGQWSYDGLSNSCRWQEA